MEFVEPEIAWNWNVSNVQYAICLSHVWNGLLKSWIKEGYINVSVDDTATWIYWLSEVTSQTGLTNWPFKVKMIKVKEKGKIELILENFFWSSIMILTQNISSF